MKLHNLRFAPILLHFVIEGFAQAGTFELWFWSGTMSDNGFE
jgi:hypothetical protein